MTGSDRKLIVFRLGGGRYALDVRLVAEVIEPPQLFPVPRAPRWLPGVINSHGALTAVLDLAVFLRSGNAAAEGKTLILDRSKASLALRVDLIEGIIPKEDVLEEQEGEDALTARLLIMADGEIREIDLACLVNRLEESINGEVMAIPGAGVMGSFDNCRQAEV